MQKQEPSSFLPKWSILFGLFLFFFALTLSVYGVSLTNDFVRWDDGLLIYENPAIREITPRSLAWIFTNFDPELYIPLTFMSFQIDMLIGGGDPFLFHFTNLLLHTCTAFLVCIFIFLLTGRKWVALFCGLLFAIHPLHTEAVAWASARKDVLSGMLFMGSVVSYLLWSVEREKGNGKRETLFPLPPFHLSLILFLLALLAKVSVLMLPFILILIDYYKGAHLFSKKIWKEKIPFFTLSFIFGVIALVGKSSVVQEATPLQMLLMACRSTIFYLQKLFVPINLSVLYPAEGGISFLSHEYILPILILSVIGGFLYLMRKNRLLIFGASFFFVMLVPSFSNMVKDGDFYFASDRYAYLASIGALLMVVSFVFNQRKFLPIFLSSTIIITFSVLAHTQSRVWANTETLFKNVITQYPSHRAYNNLGNIYRRQNLLEEAILEFKNALIIRKHPRTFSNLGAVYRKQGDMIKAMEQYRAAMELDPNDPDPHFGLGLVYAERGDARQARDSYLRAVELDPLYAEVWNNLGALYAATGNAEQAVHAYKKAIEADSLFIQAYFNLGVIFAKTGREEEAIDAYRAVISIQPDAIPARINLGILYYQAGEIEKARHQFQKILKIDPENRSARSALEQMNE